MASNLYEVLQGVEQSRKDCIKNAKKVGLPAEDSMALAQIPALFLMDKEEYNPDLEEPDWERPSDWFDSKTILETAEPIIDGSNTYYPVYIILLKDTQASTTFTKGSNSASSAPALKADAWLFSDGAFEVGTTITHTWDTTKDKDCSLNYKTRYAIAYTKTPESMTSVYIEKDMPCLEVIFGNMLMDKNISSPSSSNYVLYLYNNKTLENVEFLDTFRCGHMSILQNFSNCTNLKKVVLRGVKKIAGAKGNSTSYFCSNTPLLQYFSMPDLEISSDYGNNYGINALAGAFNNSYRLKKIDLPKLREIISPNAQGNSTSYPMCSHCFYLREINLPSLEVMTVMLPLASQCWSLRKINLPKLTSRYASATTHYMVKRCANLEILNIPLLSDMQGALIDGACSQNIKDITVPYVESMKFPLLYQEYGISNINSSYNTFFNNTIEDLTIYAKKFEFSGDALGNFSGIVTSLKFPNLEDMGRATFNLNNFPFLREFEIPKKLTIVPALTSNFIETISVQENCKQSLNLSGIVFLKRESILDIISKLADVTSESGTYTLTLGGTNLAKITEEEKAVGTAKGWTIA